MRHGKVGKGNDRASGQIKGRTTACFSTFRCWSRSAAGDAKTKNGVPLSQCSYEDAVVLYIYIPRGRSSASEALPPVVGYCPIKNTGYQVPGTQQGMDLGVHAK